MPVTDDAAGTKMEAEQERAVELLIADQGKSSAPRDPVSVPATLVVRGSTAAPRPR